MKLNNSNRNNNNKTTTTTVTTINNTNANNHAQPHVTAPTLVVGDINGRHDTLELVEGRVSREESLA